MKYTKAMRQADFFRRMSELGFTYGEAHRLRRIEMTLRRWGEAECNGEIERREKDDKPERVSQAWINGATNKRTAWLVPDREKGALKRLAGIMAAHPELWSYHQTDPRGTALYVGRREDMRAPVNLIEKKAREQGMADCVRSREMEPGRPAEYTSASLPGRTFGAPAMAANAFLLANDVPVPSAEMLPLDQYYTRGLAVGY